MECLQADRAGVGAGPSGTSVYGGGRGAARCQRQEKITGDASTEAPGGGGYTRCGGCCDGLDCWTAMR